MADNSADTAFGDAAGAGFSPSPRPTGDPLATERQLRRRWYLAHMARFEADASAVTEQTAKQRQFRDSAAEALALRAQLAASGSPCLVTWRTPNRNLTR